MQPSLNRFIRTFQKAISSEMEAMRRRLGPFEALLDEGKALDPAGENQGKLYRFKILNPMISSSSRPNIPCDTAVASRAGYHYGD